VNAVELPFTDLVRHVVGNIQEIVRSEVRLAKAEVREEAGKTAAAAKFSGAGALLAIFALGFFLLAAMFALRLVMADWLAALLVAIASGAVGGALWFAGKGRLRQVHPPEKAFQSVKEDIAVGLGKDRTDRSRTSG
jgi:hypothetical protein